ncbi:MAG: hypothetical protein RL431_959 [Actinomycetota bacterium]|jgi:cyclic-di-GMP-binding biofilm dispersal mediator protein
MTTVAGKRILITGATGVLGSTIARMLTNLGAEVVHSARNTDRLTALTIPGEKFGVDLSAPTAGSALIAAVTAAGPLDGIVCAHGVVAFGPVATASPETTTRVIAINQSSVIDIVAAAVPSLTQSAELGCEPFVLTISGVISENPVAGMSVYGSSKSGLRAFVEAAARELRRNKIRVLDTRPPHTETGLAGRAIDGIAPAFPAGLEPDSVAQRIVDAILNDEKDVTSGAFGG